MRGKKKIYTSDANNDAGEVTPEMREALNRYNDECDQWLNDCRAQYAKQCGKEVRG